MIKFTPSILILALTLGTADAFSVKPSSHQIGTTQTSSALFATVEKTGLTAPSDIPSDDIPGLFDKYVQKTYG